MNLAIRQHRLAPLVTVTVAALVFTILLITDGSVLPTQGSANPALTIMAVAARTAHHLAAGSS